MLVTSPDHTAPTLPDVLDALAERWPRLADDVDDVRTRVHQLEATVPKVVGYTRLGLDGLRSPSLEPGRSSSGDIDYADPTGAAVIATAGDWPEKLPANNRSSATVRLAHRALTAALKLDDEREVKRRLAVIAGDLEDALGHLQRALPKPGTLTRIRAEDGGDQGCTSCRRGRDSRDRPIFSPTDRKSRGACGLCGWCYEYAAEKATKAGVTDRAAATDEQWWPPVKAVEAHNRGERITVQRLTRLEADDRAARKRRDEKRKHKVRAKTRYGR